MAAPSLNFGGTPLTLPYPVVNGTARDYELRAVSRRTIAGRLRMSVQSAGYVYKMQFDAVPKADYDSLVGLWESQITSGTYPTFTWTDGWATANGVSVALDIGPMAPSAVEVGRVAYSLLLIEVEPR